MCLSSSCLSATPGPFPASLSADSFCSLAPAHNPNKPLISHAVICLTSHHTRITAHGCGYFLKRGASRFTSVSGSPTSAAFAAALLASLWLVKLPPKVWPCPLILGTLARGWGAGAEPRVRPGCEKGSSDLDSLPHKAPSMISGISNFH